MGGKLKMVSRAHLPISDCSWRRGDGQEARPGHDRHNRHDEHDELQEPYSEHLPVC